MTRDLGFVARLFRENLLGLAPLLGWWLALASPAFTRALDECSACSVDAARTLLCAPHQEEELRTMEREMAVIAEEGEANEARVIEALQAIGSLTLAHTNAPSPAVVRALERGLDHAVLRVKATALIELARGQERVETLRVALAFARGLPTLAAEVAGEVEAEEKKAKKLERESRKDDDSKTRSNDEVYFSLSRAKVLARCLEFELVRDMLANLLGQFPEDRALDELVALARSAAMFPRRPLAESPKHHFSLEILQALLAGGRRDALKLAAEMLDGYAEACKTAQAEFKKLDGARLPKVPEGWQGTESAWEERARSERLAQKKRSEDRITQLSEVGQTIHDAFARLASSRNLAPVPAWSENFPRECKLWISSQTEKFPQRLATPPAK